MALALTFTDFCWEHLDQLGRDALRQKIERNARNGVEMKGAYFAYADLSDLDLYRANLSYAEMMGSSFDNCNLAEAVLEEAVLEEASLVGANLRGARLGGSSLEKANLRAATLIEARLTWANLQRSLLVGANVRFAKLQGADLRGAILTGAALNGAWLADVLWSDSKGVTRDSVGREGADLCRTLELAENAYRGLKIHFQNVGRYRDEEWALLQEKRHSRELARINKEWRHWIAMAIWNRLAGHGTKLHYTFIWASIILILFTVAYFPNPWGWQGIVALETDCQIRCHEYLKAVYFSVVTFATLGFGDIHPVNTWGVIAVVGEVLSGYVMLGVVVATVARKMTR
jgi:uncharacterized protein YjbI with pentapeptide repeats